MVHPETITLVVVTDDNYAVLLAALLKSIEENLARGTKIDLWVVDDGITGTNKKKLHASVDQNVTTIHFKPVSEVIPEGFSLPVDRTTYPLNIFLRLFIPYFLPPAVEKALYLDVDMIVLKDLTSLWRTDITNYPLAAVLDPRIKTFDNHWGGVLNYAELGFAGDTSYFNTGLLLINIPRWREGNIAARLIDVVNKNKKFANYPDQYGMNIVLANQWLALDPLWNHFATIPHDAPYLVHFVERKPIFKAYKNNEVYKGYFYKYLALTAFKNAKPIGEFPRYLSKAKNVLAKMFAPGKAK